MISGIEKSAGYITDYLEWAEESSLSEIIEEVEVPQPVVLMGIGYLAKEGKVETVDNEGNIIRLQE